MSSFVNGDIQFVNELRTKAEGLQVLQITDVSTGEIIELGVTVNWKDINGKIVINHITGLKPSTKYKIRLVII